MTEWNARNYADVSSLQKKLADDALASLTLTGAERVLDIGCGDGKISAEIAARLPRGSVLGVDPSTHMITFAVGAFPPERFPNLRFAPGDARTLAFSAEFDVIVSFNALHWVHEQDRALQGIRTALKPQGRTLLRFVSHGPRQSLEHLIEATAHSPRWAAKFTGHRRPYEHISPENYRQLAERNGLRVNSLSVVDYAWDFTTRDAFVAWCKGTFVEWAQRLTPDEIPAFITDVLDRYAPVAGDNHTFKFYQMTAELARDGAN